MVKFIINDNDSGQRIDKFIAKALPDMPKSMMYRLIRKKDIKLNGKRCEISSRLCKGDTVTVYAGEQFVSKNKDASFKSAPPVIDVVYEDENLLIVNKPAGITVHCDDQHEVDTLINRIKHYLFIKGDFTPENESSFSPALCSRLDKNTCGLVTAAKNAHSLREINEAIRNGNVTKIYHCVAAGIPEKKSGILCDYHYKEKTGNIVRISSAPLENYREIRTGYKVIRSNNELSLLEITLYTGRTHQIRAHLAFVGTPVLGDGKYGNIPLNRKYSIFHQALCAYSLKFNFSENSALAYLNDRIFVSPLPEFERLV